MSILLLILDYEYNGMYLVAPLTETSNQLSTDPGVEGVLPTSPVNAKLTIVPLLSTTIVLVSDAKLPTKLAETVPVIVASPSTCSASVGFVNTVFPGFIRTCCPPNTVKSFLTVIPERAESSDDTYILCLLA